MMGDQKNLILAIVISVAILMLYQTFVEMPRRERQHEHTLDQSVAREPLVVDAEMLDPLAVFPLALSKLFVLAVVLIRRITRDCEKDVGVYAVVPGEKELPLCIRGAT